MEKNEGDVEVSIAVHDEMGQVLLLEVHEHFKVTFNIIISRDNALKIAWAILENM